MYNIKSCDQGCNSITRIEGDRVYKTSKNLGMERSFSEQVKQWNAFYKNTGFDTAEVTPQGELSLPYFAGDYPTVHQRLACLEKMLKAGFIMGDCRDNKNFIVIEGEANPVDFGQVYHKNDRFFLAYERIHRTEIEKLRAKAEATKLTRLASSPIMTALQKHLDDLKKYRMTKLTRNDALTQEKAQKIDDFIANTERRIDAYNNGQENAFSDFVEKNTSAIQTLNKNRVTGSIWKSILLVLFTGIAPALLGGTIQAALKKGNSFLFFNQQTTSGKMAANIQKEVSGLQLR